ncbi:LysR family transcriptional regulator [Burkholderia sp. WAC0059]|nr:LysR family transcriptional regulator [Burkholderia sp. WAC0059]
MNLLVHLDALVTWQSASRAAEALGVTQPAVSAALGRLRRLFNDPLLVREHGETSVTPRALELHRLFAPMLEQWHDLTTARTGFVASTSTRVFTVYATDYLQYVMLPQLVGGMAALAPGIGIEMRPARLHQGLAMLDSNYVEFVIGYYPDPAAELRSRFLFDEQMTCVVRNGHPCLDEAWNVEAWLSYAHLDLVAHTRHFGQRLDDTLDEIGLRRKIGVTVSSYLAAPFVLARSDMIGNFPVSIASAFAQSAGLTVLAPPIPLPQMRISLYWHERYQSDVAHAWFRHYIGQQRFGVPTEATMPAGREGETAGD